MADIFDIDFALQNRNLISPNRRTAKTLAFAEAMSDALQDLRDLILGDYKDGSAAAAYNNGTAYVLYDRVKWTDMGIYELIVATSTGVDPTGEALSETNWVKVLDNYIGSDERGAYTMQFILLTYAINKWFNVTSSPYIYIVNNNAAGLSFELYVPAAVYAGLGSTNNNRDARLNEFLSKYSAAGMTISILTY